jgi:hypothetical protein
MTDHYWDRSKIAWEDAVSVAPNRMAGGRRSSALDLGEWHVISFRQSQSDFCQTHEKSLVKVVQAAANLMCWWS